MVMKRGTILKLLVGLLLPLAIVSCTAHRTAPVADVHGECPKCSTMVEGHRCFWDGEDDKGNPVSGTFFTGTCPSCKADLRAHDDLVNTNVAWQVMNTK